MRNKIIEEEVKAKVYKVEKKVKKAVREEINSLTINKSKVIVSINRYDEKGKAVPELFIRNLVIKGDYLKDLVKGASLWALIDKEI